MTDEQANEILARREGWTQVEHGWHHPDMLRRSYDEIHPTYHDNADNLRRVMAGLTREERELVTDRCADMYADPDNVDGFEEWLVCDLWTHHLPDLARIVAEVIGASHD